jgi:hypothetical protein
MDGKQNTWITCALLVPTILSASLLFRLAEIQMSSVPTAAIYCTSLSGFSFLYLGAATLALKQSKSESSSGSH